jgi:hypothetical protein
VAGALGGLAAGAVVAGKQALKRYAMIWRKEWERERETKLKKMIKKWVFSFFIIIIELYLFHFL